MAPQQRKQAGRLASAGRRHPGTWQQGGHGEAGTGAVHTDGGEPAMPLGLWHSWVLGGLEEHCMPGQGGGKDRGGQWGTSWAGATGRAAGSARGVLARLIS